MVCSGNVVIQRQHAMHDDTVSYDPDFKPLRTGEGLLIAFLDCCGFPAL